MRRAKTFGLAGAAALLSTASLAADLPPPVFRQPVPVPVAVVGGWYLRGFIGAGNQFLSEISHPDFLTAPQFGFLDKGGFDSAPFGGGGIGYQWNNWLRVDATIEYRGQAGFHALDQFFNPFQFSGPTFNTNQYTASKSELVALANFFLDLRDILVRNAIHRRERGCRQNQDRSFPRRERHCGGRRLGR